MYHDEFMKQAKHSEGFFLFFGKYIELSPSKRYKQANKLKYIFFTPPTYKYSKADVLSILL